MTTSLLSTVPHGSIDSMRLADLANLVLRSRDQAVPDNPSDLLEAAFPTRGRAGISGVGGVDELLNIITTWSLDGWRQGVDTLSGVYRIVSASSYLEEKLATVGVHPKMTRIGRGEVAPSANFEVDSASSRIMKFGLQFILAEEDMIDGAPLGVWRIAVEESLRAARNLVGDLLWSTLVKNPVCADGLKIFDDGRGNKSQASLDKTELDAAMLAVAGHTGVDDGGNPVHYNLRPNFLIVCPSKLHEARRLVRPTIVDGSELRVLAESRMGQAGVLDPVAGEVLVAGNGRNWMLAAGGEQKASLVLSLLHGATEPRIRQFALDGGRWGIGFDVSFSCGVTALSGAPLYWSTSDG